MDRNEALAEGRYCFDCDKDSDILFTEAVDILDLLGCRFVRIQLVSDEELYFVTDDGRFFMMYHVQDCCESVYLEDVSGDLDNLLGEHITEAELRRSCLSSPKSQTWSFYHLATNKDRVTLRWYGTSNGYYSEEVDLVELYPNNEGVALNLRNFLDGVDFVQGEYTLGETGEIRKECKFEYGGKVFKIGEPYEYTETTLPGRKSFTRQDLFVREGDGFVEVPGVYFGKAGIPVIDRPCKYGDISE